MVDRFADQDERNDLFNSAKQVASKNFNIEYEDLNQIQINFTPVMYN